MYKKTSDNSQGRIDRRLLRDVPGGNDLTFKEQYEMLHKKLHELNVFILTLEKDSPERKQLGRQKFRLQCEIKKLRDSSYIHKKRKGLAMFFMQEAHKILERDLYEAIEECARRAYDIKEGLERDKRLPNQIELEKKILEEKDATSRTS